MRERERARAGKNGRTRKKRKEHIVPEKREENSGKVKKEKRTEAGFHLHPFTAYVSRDTSNEAEEKGTEGILSHGPSIKGRKTQGSERGREGRNFK